VRKLRDEHKQQTLFLGGKNMRVSRRILALALALLMIVGLMTTASARTLNTMSDRAQVASEYRMATAMLYSLGILEGFPDNTFRPTTTVNRAQMTQLIFRATNPGQAAPEIATVFTDVYPGSGAYWARGYIAWAHGQGIVVGDTANGVPTGTFRPNDPVTIVEAAIMILRGLGYGANNEYVGANWAQNASNDALALGILNADIVDQFDVRDGAQRQVAAQMLWNAFFLPHQEFISALNIYRPLRPHRCWACINGLPCDPTIFDEPMNEEPVVVGGADFVPGVGGGAYTWFYGLDSIGGGTPNAVPVGGQITWWHAVSPSEIGRVVNVYGNPVTSDIFFIDVLSTDVTVAAGATNAQRLAALGITNANLLSDRRGNDVAVFVNYACDGDGVDVAAITGIVSGTANPVATTAAFTEIALMNAMQTTWVLFNDAAGVVDGDNKFRTVLHSTRTVEDVSAIAGNQVVIGDATVARTQVTLRDGLTWANLGADPTELDAVAEPLVRYRWANVTRTLVGGQVHFTLEPVEMVTGIVTEAILGPGTAAGFRFAGGPALNYVSPNTPAGVLDNGQNSERLDSIDDEYFMEFLEDGINPTLPNTQVWTAYISDVTGNVVAVEAFVPNFDNAELVMVTQTGWEGLVGRAAFVREDGTTRAFGPAMPVMPAGTDAAALQNELNSYIGLVAWAVNVGGTYFLVPVADADIAQIDGTNNQLQGTDGTPAGTLIDFGNPNQPLLFEPSFVPDDETQQARTLTTATRFILSDGTTWTWPNTPVGQDMAVPFNALVWTLCEDLETIHTVFVVAATRDQGLDF